MAGRADKADKRDAILRAAIDIFAGPRLLQRPGRRRRPRRRRRRRHRLPLLPRQGRPARLDLRADDEGGDRRRARAASPASPIPLEQLRDDRARSTSIAWAATATSPSSSRSSCASRPSSWSASRRRTCASTSASSATSSPTARRRACSGREINPTLAAKLFFGALDEMATNWILSRRKYSLASEADAIVDLFVRRRRRAAAASATRRAQ